MFSILGKGKVKKTEESSEYIQDLNIDILLKQMEKGYEDYEIAGYYENFPEDEGDIRFRQQVMAEMGWEELCRGLKNFFHDIERAEEYESHGAETSGESRAHWHLSAAYTFYCAVDQLIRCLEKCRPESEGWQGCLAMLSEIRDRQEYRRRHDLAVKTYEDLAALRYSIRIERDHVAVLPRVQTEDLIGELNSRFPEALGMPEGLLTLLPGLESGKLETHIFQYLKKKNPACFSAMKEFESCPDFWVEEVRTLQRELAFYLSFYDFQKHMEYYGHVFCFPEFCREEMRVRDGYDLALAWKNQEEGKKVVCNDYFYQGEERFLVVTGPNQGGKTTFARSAGQLVYFSLLGLPVPAQEARLPLFTELVTHFSVEESMESGRGKLQEELIRLSPMLQEEKSHAFVVINELFTSAATMDATRMGRKVMEHFLGRDCYGIYVTHIEELARESERIVSMVASVAGERRHMRTYKMERTPAKGEGCTESIVEEYGLSYEQIMARKGGECI